MVISDAYLESVSHVPEALIVRVPWTGQEAARSGVLLPKRRDSWHRRQGGPSLGRLATPARGTGTLSAIRLRGQTDVCLNRGFSKWMPSSA